MNRQGQGWPASTATCSKPGRGTGGMMGRLGPMSYPFVGELPFLHAWTEEGHMAGMALLPHSDFLPGSIRCWSGSWHAPICWPACVCTFASCAGGRRQRCLLSAQAHQLPGPLPLRESPCRAEVTVRARIRSQRGCTGTWDRYPERKYSHRVGT